LLGNRSFSIWTKRRRSATPFFCDLVTREKRSKPCGKGLGEDNNRRPERRGETAYANYERQVVRQKRKNTHNNTD